ncbi:MAG: ribosomal RNA small subunit methyltransferase A [Chloroflexi bacterium]|nr:MAG: ribosomal RNA small subunit methyltransferase A [Chloroflexota bacterium]
MTPARKRALDLTDPSAIRGVARRFGVRYLRRWGQNFLADRSQLERLMEALQLSVEDRVVEVGPGLGALTIELAERARAVVGVEIDPAAVKALALTLHGRSNVRIIEANILRTAVSELLPAPYRVIGNIPYNLTGALFTHLLEEPAPPARIDLLVQREVAERLVAPPGGWSLATLGVRVYGTPELVLRVPRTAFVPQPKVDSALVRIVPDAQPALPRDQLPSFFAFVTPFFQARRKQLAYVFGRKLGVGGAEARAQLSVIGIDPARRAETLTLEEWRRLFLNERAP